MADLSVIIPTYNRKGILLKTLRAYEQQLGHEEILEILVLDDNSVDGTAEAVMEYSKGTRVPVRYFGLTHRGQAALRNYGIREAQGRLVLFGDDDIVPANCLVKQHVAWHEKHSDTSVAVLGLVEWAPEVRPTPFMEWLSKDGVLFGFGHLRAGQEVDARFFYSCNVSLKRSFLIENGVFDEDFRGYGFEDTELGFRLSKKGLRILYNPHAVGYHHKRVSFADACERAVQVEEARQVLATKEGGIYLAECEKAQKRPPFSKLRRTVRNGLVPLLAPFKPLLDSRLRLPDRVYRAFYNYYAEAAAQSVRRKNQGKND
ncbi:MAG TPA: glycosyltransferase [Terriglobia bacterium]|nr:glycosyltransferase [Terriglobia bacterium]